MTQNKKGKTFLSRKISADQKRVVRIYGDQCDQIGQFIVRWAAFHSLWQQLICPNCPYNLPNFYKGVKIYHFSIEIIFRQLLWTFGDFSGHTDGDLLIHYSRILSGLSPRGDHYKSHLMKKE